MRTRTRALNGVGKLSAEKIQAKARTAAESAEAVRLHGTVRRREHVHPGHAAEARRGTGSVAAEGTMFWLLRVGEQLFLKADAEFWSHDGGDAAPPRSWPTST